MRDSVVSGKGSKPRVISESCQKIISGAAAEIDKVKAGAYRLKRKTIKNSWCNDE